MSPRFSERMGITQPVIQTDSVNVELRNSLWNAIYWQTGRWVSFAVAVAHYFLKTPIDETPRKEDGAEAFIRQRYFELEPWYMVYEFIEFYVEYKAMLTTDQSELQKVEDAFNVILEREYSAFRFVSRVLTSITNPTEMTAISEAIGAAQEKGLAGASLHLRSAIKLFGKKPDPDYRNAIKEAISAVESMSKQLTGSNSAGLDGALKELSKRVTIHPALVQGFLKLYGWTSDENGIRHCILDQPNIGFTEAKFMIVTCSAFVNYLIDMARRADLLK